MHEYDVAIVGGGPAGLTAAKTLTKAGHNVIVFEEHSIIGQPIQCGEGISYNALKQFNLLKFQNRFVANEYKSCDLHFPKNSIIKGDIHAFTIYRDSFDQLLAKLAQDEGSEILLSSRVTKIVRNKEGFEITINNSLKSQYFSKFILLGEGVHAKLAKKLGFFPPSPTIKAFEYQLEGKYSDTMEFHFDYEKFPYGYCWVFPKANSTNVGIVSTAKNRKERLDLFLKEQGIRCDILQKIGGQIPMNGPSKILSIGHAMLLGDTAGMVNPIFYGGIRLAMFSGLVAGQVLNKNLKKLERKEQVDLSEFQKILKKYPFMRNVNLRCHNFFYSRDNLFLSKLGEVLNGQYINRLRGIKAMKTVLQIAKNPVLYKKLRGFISFYIGFKIARDWGF